MTKAALRSRRPVLILGWRHDEDAHGALDPLRLAGAILFIALWQAATTVVSPIILPGTLVRVAAGRGRFLVGAGAILLWRRRSKSVRPTLLYTAENVAIAVLHAEASGDGAERHARARVLSVRAAGDRRRSRGGSWEEIGEQDLDLDAIVG